MYRWIMAVGGSTLLAAAGWAVGKADEGFTPGYPGPPHHPPMVAMELESVTGKITEQTTAPSGEVDGAKLEDGTWLHWPPHLEKYLGKMSEAGQEVKAEARRQPGPQGKEVLEVFVLTNIESKATFLREETPPPPPHGGPFAMGGPCPHGGPHPGPPHHPPMMRGGPMQPPPPHGPMPGQPRPGGPMHPPGGPPAVQPPGVPPGQAQPPQDERMKVMEDRLKRIEEQLGQLVDQGV